MSEASSHTLDWIVLSQPSPELPTADTRWMSDVGSWEDEYHSLGRGVQHQDANSELQDPMDDSTAQTDFLAVHRDCMTEIDHLRTQINESRESHARLEKALREKVDELQCLRSRIRPPPAEQFDILAARLKSFEEGVKRDEFLGERSPVYKHLRFRNFIHEKYDQLVDSESSFADLETFNKELEMHFNIETAFQGPQHNETYYIVRLKELKTKIHHWVVKITGGGDLSLDPINSVLKALSGLSRNGERTVRYIQEHNFIESFNIGRYRRTLYAHIFSLAIYERILSCFVFGTVQSLSKKLYMIQNSILTQGIHQCIEMLILDACFERVLTVRQALGTAALQNTDDLQQLKRKQEIVSELMELFSDFLPEDTCKAEDIFNIVNMAVDIRNDMTGERAIYSCFWFPADAEINLDSLFYEFDGWRDQPLSLCVSPGLCESIMMDDGGLVEICVAPANVQLD